MSKILRRYQQTLLHPIRIFVFSGTSTPASFAISYADFPGDLAVQGAVDDDRLAHCVKLFARFQEIAASVCEFFLHWRRIRCPEQYGLLGSTDHTIVKCLGMMIEFTAILISAVSSMMTGVLPAPTPRAGFPEE